MVPPKAAQLFRSRANHVPDQTAPPELSVEKTRQSQSLDPLAEKAKPAGDS